MNATPKSIALALIVAGTIAIAGCAPAAAPTPVETTAAAVPSPAPVETEAAEPAEPAAPVIEVGAVIDAGAAEALNAERGDDRAYEMSDGTFIVVNKGEAFPAEVKEDIAAVAVEKKAVGPQSFDGDSNIVNGQITMAANRRAGVINGLRSATGKNIILVVHTAAGTSAGNVVAWIATNTSPAFLEMARNTQIATSTAEAAAAQAQNWVDSQADADNYEVVIVR